ncbi:MULTISPECIES: CaiB/BaiF CoA transferase family protein [unclassified Brevundimonas]|uniref:CaiB/BaiF CoA transferase family protein n=1 Tax=unclassified Brevundimonas TaxID=2622653 RepID=UPI0025BEAC2F|nr:MULTISPECIES: CaiB/BaiF CoA-transferase family protein [unclassified Brevundimonas]
MSGPLHGLRIVEVAGLGPGPFAAMMLADHGAEVIRVQHPDAPVETRDPLLRSRTILSLDLKKQEDREQFRRLCRCCDALIEGFRPGVMERLGLGPEVLLLDNPKLVYGRMTGWGQTGPLAATAGHDINYIAISGALGLCGRKDEKPTPPVNLVGDFGGGGMLMAFGILAALMAVRNGAGGQVIDAAMTDGSALLTSMMWGFKASGFWMDQRGVNVLDTGAPFYETYATADGQYIAIGAIEPQFYARLLECTGLSDDPLFSAQMSPADWPAQKARLAEVFATRTRDEWAQVFETADACFAPVLSMGETPAHPHNRARQTYIEVAGVTQPAPAPRFSATPSAHPNPPQPAGTDVSDFIRTLEEQRRERP